MLNPTPPPSVRPATPTLKQRPCVIATPALRHCTYTSRLRAPPPNVAMPVVESKANDVIRVRSIMSPVVVE
jgi:hypothetical protein